MAELQQLQQLEAACQELYLCTDVAARGQLEAAMGRYATSIEHIGLLKSVLDASASPYAQVRGCCAHTLSLMRAEGTAG